MKFKIELINIGREKVCKKYEIETDNFTQCSIMVYAKVKRYLSSENVSLVPDNNDKELWNVYAGYHKVGEVMIKEIVK